MAVLLGVLANFITAGVKNLPASIAAQWQAVPGGFARLVFFILVAGIGVFLGGWMSRRRLEPWLLKEYVAHIGQLRRQLSPAEVVFPSEEQELKFYRDKIDGDPDLIKRALGMWKVKGGRFSV